MSSALEAVLRLIGIAIHRLGLDWLLIRARSRSVRVLLYHACEQDESDYIRGLRSNTTPAGFETQLEYLQRRYNVVGLRGLEEARLPERPVLITFDDGYRSVYENAFPLLRERGLTAVVYLVGDVMSGAALVWVNELNFMMHRYPAVALPLAREAARVDRNAAPHRVIAALQSAYESERIADLIRRLRAAGCNADPKCGSIYLTWSEVREMAAAGIAFGNHTQRHPSLPNLTEPEQRHEIIEAHELLRRELGTCTSLSYPFGRFNGTSRRLGIDLGYASIMEVGGRADAQRPHAIGRVVVSARSAAELFAEMEVVAPLKGWVASLRGRLLKQPERTSSSDVKACIT